MRLRLVLHCSRLMASPIAGRLSCGSLRNHRLVRRDRDLCTLSTVAQSLRPGRRTPSFVCVARRVPPAPADLQSVVLPLDHAFRLLCAKSRVVAAGSAAAHLLPAVLVSGEQCRANTRIVHIHRGEHIRPWHHVVGIRLNRTLSDNGLVRVAAPTIRDLMTITMAVQTTFCEWRHL